LLRLPLIVTSSRVPKSPCRPKLVDADVVSIVGGVDAGRAADALLDRAPAEAADLVAGDHSEGGGDLGLLLFVLWLADHRQLRELLEARVREVGRRCARSAEGECRGQFSCRAAGAATQRRGSAGRADPGRDGFHGCRSCRPRGVRAAAMPRRVLRHFSER